MEKAMQSAHGVGYETYMRKHDVRMDVEESRQKDYEKSQQLLASLDTKVHSNI